MWLVPQERTSRINTLSEIRWRPGQRPPQGGAMPSSRSGTTLTGGFAGVNERTRQLALSLIHI